MHPWFHKWTLWFHLTLCKAYPHFLQRINGLASRVTDLECVPFHLDALNSLDLWELVSDNERSFCLWQLVYFCSNTSPPPSLPWVSEVAWVACLNIGLLTIGYGTTSRTFKFKRIRLARPTHPPRPTNCEVLCKLTLAKLHSGVLNGIC